MRVDLWPVRGWLSPTSPTPPRPRGSGGGERGAGRERVDTHRPKLPVWASCRMRCSCLFIILGAGWGPRGHGGEGGEGPAAPGPACLRPQRRSRPGWVGGALRFLGQPRSGGRSLPPPPRATPPPAPRSLLSPSLFSRSPPASGRPAGPRPVPATVAPAAAWRSTGCVAAPPPGPAPPNPGGGKQVSRLQPPRGRTPGSTPPAGPRALGFSNFCTPLKGKEGSMLGSQRPRTGLSSPYWPIWACPRMLPWTPSPEDLLANLS